ncbi:MAG TPA: IS4 family transposase [Thermoanaerobaculaceae bacterium]|nr:IS4 family transposase [Thermoanaerobaculaceae bacterium]
MQNHIALQERALALIVQLRQSLITPAFWRRHRRRPTDFTRECVLTFPVLMLLLLQKSLKSLQTHAQEFFWQLSQGVGVPSLSAGAVTHARAKLRPSAFVELNQAVLHAVYGPAHAGLVRRWHGHRLLGVDSSLVRLPSRVAVGEQFGWVQCANHRGLQERYPQGRVSVFYDVLNEVALEARLVASTVAETELAHQHLACVQPGDMVLNDRGFTGYRWLVAVRAAGAHFVSRCSRGSFAAVQRLFARNEAGVSVAVTLTAPKEVRAECHAQGWPLELTVRLVTGRLKSGELEVLVTSLLDAVAYPTEELAEVYWQRWGHETYYGRLKGRLDLEHCSGQTVEAVEQDFHATVLLSNVESVVIGPAQAQLAERTARRRQPAQVNRAVSVHALKYRLIELLSSRVPAERVLTELTVWFQANPVSVRSERQVRRRKFSPSRSYHYQRRVRKFVF